MIVTSLGLTCPYGPDESGANIESGFTDAASGCQPLAEQIPGGGSSTRYGYDISAGQALNPGDVLRVPSSVATAWPWLLGGLVVVVGGVVAVKVARRRRQKGR